MAFPLLTRFNLQSPKRMEGIFSFSRQLFFSKNRLFCFRSATQGLFSFKAAVSLVFFFLLSKESQRMLSLAFNLPYFLRYPVGFASYGCFYVILLPLCFPLSLYLYSPGFILFLFSFSSFFLLLSISFTLILFLFYLYLTLFFLIYAISFPSLFSLL